MAKKEIKQENSKKSKKEEKNKRHFFKDFKAELKRVVWPTPKQLVNSTIAVITIVLVIGVIVFLLDMGFELLNKQNVKLQGKLQQNTTETVEDENTTSEEESDEASSEESSETEEVEKNQEEQEDEDNEENAE